MSKNRAARALKKRQKRRGRGRPARDPSPPPRKPRVRRPRAVEERRTRGYAGMPRAEWEGWRQAAETFVAERPHAHDEQVVAVLTLGLGLAPTWGDFLAGRWLQLVGVEVYMHDVEGYSFRRAYRLMERFVSWLHDRGDLTAWQHGVLLGAIDDMRESHGGERRREARVVEMVLTELERERVFAEFEATLESAHTRRYARKALAAADTLMRMHLGGARHNPLGSIDVERFAADWLSVGVDPEDMRFSADVFALLARFYRWLGDTGRLDAARAGSIAWRLRQLTRAARAA